MTDKEVLMIEFIRFFINDDDLKGFKFSYDGNCTAGNQKRLTRVSIQLPREIVNDNLKDLDKWIIFGVAMPIERVNDYLAKFMEEEQ